MAVDFTHQVVIVSLPQANVLSFVNYSGQVLSTLNVTHPMGIVMAPGDANAYVAVFGGVDEISMQTLQVTATTPPPPGLYPTYVALAGDRLWTEMSDSGVGQPPYTGNPIYSVDPSDLGAGFTYSGASETAPAVLASPSPTSGELFAGSRASSPANLDLYSVSGTSLATIASNNNFNAYVAQASFTADGSILYLSCSPPQAPYSVCSYRLPDLTTPMAVYSIGPYVGGAVVTPDGSRLVVGTYETASRRRDAVDACL